MVDIERQPHVTSEVTFFSNAPPVTQQTTTGCANLATDTQENSRAQISLKLAVAAGGEGNGDGTRHGSVDAAWPPFSGAEHHSCGSTTLALFVA